jgi:hypothetical protein
MGGEPAGGRILPRKIKNTFQVESRISPPFDNPLSPSAETGGDIWDMPPTTCNPVGVFSRRVLFLQKNIIKANNLYIRMSNWETLL